MTDEMMALGRRAVACKGWRWMPGMAIGGMSVTSFGGLWWLDFGRVLDVRDDDGMQMVSASEYPYDDEGVPEYRWADATHIPYLSDPATLGCLLALVREAWRDPSKLWDGHMEVQRDHQSLFFAVQLQHDADGFLQEQHRATGTSEAEALVAALEAAP